MNSLQVESSVTSGYEPRIGTAEPHSSSTFSLLRNLHTAPQWLHQFTLTTSSTRLPQPSPASIICGPLVDSHLSCMRRYPTKAPKLTFPKISNTKHSPKYLLVILAYLLLPKNANLDSSPTVQLGSAPLTQSCRTPLDTNPLAVALPSCLPFCRLSPRQRKGEEHNFLYFKMIIREYLITRLLIK